MNKLIAIVAVLLVAGCKGEQGDPGATGATGTPGASATSFIVNRSGVVNSDSIAVTIPNLSISRGDILNVYTCINTACVQINLYQPGAGNNIYYIAQGTTVTINNALTGTQTLWYISALEKL